MSASCRSAALTVRSDNLVATEKGSVSVAETELRSVRGRAAGLRRAGGRSKIENRDLEKVAWYL